ncbi:MAG: hypothetical protein K2Q01_11205 [Rickettsiales bacterium]|nr:hypothetical protein [Rickettsiales bacterium]
MQINELQNNVLTEQKLGDLRERSHDLEKKIGKPPMTWNEFNEANPQEKPKTLRNMLIGAVLGAAVVGGLVLTFASGGAFAGLMALLPPIVGGFIGAALGGHMDNTQTRRTEQVGKYEAYLSAFEELGGRGMERAPQVAQTKTTHAAELVQNRSAEVAHYLR